jgi:cell filamentation protein
MDTSGNKYHIPENEAEILPNLLGLTRTEEIADAEFRGFYLAQEVALSSLKESTIIDIQYIYKLHKLALEDVYSFAGKLRTVNISKAGFLFPSAQFLPTIMQEFQNEILSNLPKSYSSHEKLINDIAIVHGELLFIHPFREGNGRLARIIANVMLKKQGEENLEFSEFDIDGDRFEDYVYAVQQVAHKNYMPMKEIIKIAFSS